MANLGTVTIEAKDGYVDLEEISGLTFTSGNKYSIQILNSAYLREGSLGDGFQIMNDIPITITYKGDKLYVKAMLNFCTVNIAE